MNTKQKRNKQLHKANGNKTRQNKITKQKPTRNTNSTTQTNIYQQQYETTENKNTTQTYITTKPQSNTVKPQKADKADQLKQNSKT